VSKILLGLLVTAFVGTGGTVILGADETLERRKGKHIKAKGVFRDAVRSSRKHTVTSFGLRWISLMVLVSVPWSSRVWALPFLTVLAPSKKSSIANGKRHKTSIDWIMQMISQVRRWLPTRKLVLVVDGGLIALKLGHRCLSYANPVTLVARFRLDAQLSVLLNHTSWESTISRENPRRCLTISHNHNRQRARGSKWCSTWRGPGWDRNRICHLT
jgi:hypothetical protein